MHLATLHRLKPSETSLKTVTLVCEKSKHLSEYVRELEESLRRSGNARYTLNSRQQWFCLNDYISEIVVI